MSNRKEYMKEYNKKYRAEHKEEMKEYNKRYSSINKERRRELHEEWVKRNPDYMKQYNKKYNKEHKDEMKERNRKRREDNPEKHNEYNKRWAKNNPDKIREKTRIYYQNNVEKIKEYSKKYNTNNIEKIREIHRQYTANRRKTNLKYNLNCKMSRAIHHSLKGNKAGRHWETLVGYTLNKLMEHLNKTIPTGYTWNDYMNGILHIDHIVPISVFNFTKPEHPDFKRCWTLENLRLLTKEENRIKSNKMEKSFQPALAM